MTCAAAPPSSSVPSSVSSLVPLLPLTSPSLPREKGTAATPRLGQVLALLAPAVLASFMATGIVEPDNLQAYERFGTLVTIGIAHNVFTID